MQTKELIQGSKSKKLASHEQIMLVGLMIQSVIDLIDEGMFNVAMPTMQEAFGLPIDVLSLLVAVRYLARIGLMPIYGFVGDRFGKKRTFTIGLAIFVLGSFISLLSPSIFWLVIGRMLQGMGGGILPLAMAIISDHFRLVPSTRVNQGPKTSVDWLGAAALFTFVTGLLMSTTTSSVFPFGSTANLLFWSAAGLSLIMLLWNAARNPNSLINLDVLKNRQLIVPSIAIIFRMFALSGTVFLMVLYLANVFNRSPQAVGLLIIAQSLPIFIFVPIGGLLADRWTSRNAAVLGSLIQTSGMLWLGFVDPKMNDLLLIPGMVLGGLGAGISLTPFTKGAVAALGDENAGLAAGLYNMIRFTGAAASAPLLGLLLAAGFEKAGGIESIPDPYQLGFRILTLCALVGAWIASRMPITRALGEEAVKEEI
jgi:MFS family permease